MSTLKHRMFDYMQEYKLFLRIHHGGFAHGIHSAYLGYLIEEAPTAAAIHMWTKQIQIEMQLAWNHPDAIKATVCDAIIKQFPDYASSHHVTFPINIEMAKLMAINTDKQTIDTHGLYVSTPVAYAKAANNILDGIILQTKTLPALVSAALRRENASLYYLMLVRRAKFMHYHRNIQIIDIDPARFDSHSRPLLESHPKVHRVYLDSASCRAHVCTTEASFFHVRDRINAELAVLPVAYQPTCATSSDVTKGRAKPSQPNT
jgi:hypothetical protein